MFVIQHNMMNEDTLKRVKAAIDVLKIPHVYVGIIPFSREITSDEPLIGTNHLVYGSTLMTTLTEGWAGNYFDPKTFRSEVWSMHRGDMLNNVSLELADAIKFLKQQDPKSLWFTRPCEDLKQFSGQVIEAEECWKWFEDAIQCASSGSYQLSPDTKVVLTEPKNIHAEWRWFIVNGKVVSGSMYRLNGQLDKRIELDTWVISEAQRFADVWLPHRNCVMDLALLDTGEVKVIEFNTINSSGLYDHNTYDIIKALWEDFTQGNNMNNQKSLHHPKLYWVFAQIVRILLLPTVLLVDFYESVMKIEAWERRIFVGLCLFIAGMLIETI